MASQHSTCNLHEVPIKSDKSDQPERSDDEDDIPVVYVDIPNSENNHQLFEQANSVESTSRVQRNDYEIIMNRNDFNPDVSRYATSDVREGVSRDYEALPQGSSSSEPSFVNTTIFFDQFRNKRIDVNMARSSPPPGRPAPAPPSLQIHQPVDDGLNLSPLPLDLPTSPLPPPYSEIDMTPTVRPARRATPPPVPPPPVIANENMSTLYSQANSVYIPPVPRGTPLRRKVLTCQHCGLRVHTIVLKQAGLATHLIAMSFLLFCLLPITALVYYTNCMKYDNHYCQFCNKLIGYEFPCLCQKLVYVAPDP